VNGLLHDLIPASRKTTQGGLHFAILIPIWPCKTCTNQYARSSYPSFSQIKQPILHIASPV